MGIVRRRWEVRARVGALVVGQLVRQRQDKLAPRRSCDVGSRQQHGGEEGLGSHHGGFCQLGGGDVRVFG